MNVSPHPLNVWFVYLIDLADWDSGFQVLAVLAHCHGVKALDWTAQGIVLGHVAQGVQILHGHLGRIFSEVVLEFLHEPSS